MAKLENCELWFCKLNPKRPSTQFNKQNPTWECQIRTYSKEVKKQWEELGLNVKTTDPDDGPLYYRVNLRKRSLKADGSPSTPVEVVDGRMRPVDPNSIGHGSIGHVRIFQREYTKDNGKPGISSTLMGIQLIKHIVYTYDKKSYEDSFEDSGDTEVISPPEEEEEEEGEESSTPEVKDKPERVF